nr:MAG TPA: hypothetical protein [Caudoviricetes sp.]
MTAQEYIQEKYRAMGVSLSEGYVSALLSGMGISPNGEMLASDGSFGRIHRAFVESIPEFLLMPTSVSELGVSITRASKEDIAKYYNLECKRLGIPDRLTEQPKVRFL